MKLIASKFKPLVKKAAVAGAEHIFWNMQSGQITAPGQDLVAVLIDPLLAGEDHDEFAVNGRQFFSVCSRLSGEVAVSPGLTSLEICSSKARFELAFVPKKAPAVPLAQWVQKLPLAAVRSVLKYATTASDPKQKLTYNGSVQLKSVGSENELRLQAAGTDGRRLAVATVALPEGKSLPVILFPAPMVDAMSEFEGETCWVGGGDNNVYLAVGSKTQNLSLVAPKRAKEFVDFERFVPAKFDFQAKISVEAMREALKNTAPLTDVSTASLGFAGSALKIQTGEGKSLAEDVVDVEVLRPDPLFEDSIPIKFGTDHACLADFFKVVSGDVLLSATANNNSPVLLEAGDYRLLLAVRGVA